MNHANRVIKRPDYQPVQVTEYDPKDSEWLLGKYFDMPEYAETQPAEPFEWALEEMKPSRFGRKQKKGWSNHD